jgi:Carbohydrate binding module (family 6)
VFYTLQIILSIFALAITALAADVHTDKIVASGNYDIESHPDNQDTVRTEDGQITYIQNNSWVAYKGGHFGPDATYFWIEGATIHAGGVIELRTGSVDGPLIGTVKITSTGGWSTYQQFGTVLSPSITGEHDIYLKFLGGSGFIFNTRSFCFQSIPPGLKRVGSLFDATQFDAESAPGIAPITPKDGILGSISGGSWVAYRDFDFGAATNFITIEGAAPGKGGTVELRLDSAQGQLLGSVDICHTGGWGHFRPFTNVFSKSVSGVHHLYLCFVDTTGTKGDLFRIRNFTLLSKASPPAEKKAEGNLHVYPPVRGLEPSPYYSFSVQKASRLIETNKNNPANWLHPFAWFTRCVDKDTAGSTAYYSNFIGGWSHTYCNFELDRNTPIIVKITRSNQDTGAPFGPIKSASARPAHKVDKCEVINGEVYVTMSQPGLIAVDIDGQMDSRNVPRVAPSVGGDFGGFPHANKSTGAHGVTIFANPVIEDKPKLGAPGVYAVEPGTLPPRDGSWKTLYFKPGVHKLSANADGSERPWQSSDPYFLNNNKNYYIPGDAIVYGNFSDFADNQISENIRVFGHGTICGTKIPHFQDLPPGALPGSDNKKLRILALTNVVNCIFEGVTIADPPEHGVYLEYGSVSTAPSYIKWVKNITWRVNNDGGGVTGNGYVEDCFFRHQDDALYVRGAGIRRCVFWSDVNGTPLRCSFINGDRGPGYPSTAPQDLIVEDCDIIYARGVFLFGGGGVIDPAETGLGPIYEDGARNTAQHLIFRNIRVSDPKPVRTLFSLNASPGGADPADLWAGIRFENLHYEHPQTWGWKNQLNGNNGARLRYLTFKNVIIAGERLDDSYLNDPAKFETKFVSDSIFK